MIKYKCPNCKRETEQEQKKVIVMCGCGYTMEILEEGGIKE